jgi:hypothetical protein
VEIKAWIAAAGEQLRIYYEYFKNASPQASKKPYEGTPGDG